MHPLHVILAALGSAGDVNPMIGIGQRLKSRGHQVTLLANDFFAETIRRAGLIFGSIGAEADFHAAHGDADLWHWSRYWRVNVQRQIIPTLRPLYDAIAWRYVPGQTVVAASTLCLGARIARDSLGVPLTTVHLSPTAIRSVERPAKLHAWFFPEWGESSVRWQYHIADAVGTDPVLQPALNQLRAELQLPPIEHPMAEWCHSPDRVIGLFPDWYAPPASDWPEQVRLAGFPRVDLQEQNPCTPELEKFLRAGPPPVAFSPGSAMKFGKRFFETSVEVCRRLGCRGLFLSAYDEHIPKDLPDWIHHERHVPYGWLFPRLRGIVHHGGAGVTSMALAAGIAQLCVPMAHDQFDHAARVQSLGVGEWVRRYRPRSAARQLRALFDSSPVARRCQKVASLVNETSDPLSLCCDLIEQTAPSSAPLPGVPVGAPAAAWGGMPLVPEPFFGPTPLQSPQT